jgi:membrane dipeptidase
MGALDVAKVPVVWSHSSVMSKGSPSHTLPVWQARQLSLETARAIAGKGGVIGLWAVRTDVGQTIEAYANRLSEMADWLGEDHVAFGTDMNGIRNPVVADYADVRRVIEHWERRRIDERRIRKLAIENYARVLKRALSTRQA